MIAKTSPGIRRKKNAIPVSVRHNPVIKKESGKPAHSLFLSTIKQVVGSQK